MKCSRVNIRLIAVGLVATVLAGNGYALIRNGTVAVRLHGVDVGGNPSVNLGDLVDGKSYKDTRTGIIVQVASGQVKNDYGQRVRFEDQGLTITDPLNTSITYTATADFETVTRPANTRFGAYAHAVQVAVYETGTLTNPPTGPNFPNSPTSPTRPTRPGTN